MCRRRAARPILPSSATATKYWSWVRLTRSILSRAFGSALIPERYWTPAGAALHNRRMRVTILGEAEREGMRRAGRIAAATLATVGSALRAGMTTREIDVLVRH